MPNALPVNGSVALKILADSTFENVGGITTIAPPNHVIRRRTGLGLAGAMPEFMDNILVALRDYNWGVSGQTIKGMEGRIGIASNAATGNTADASTGASADDQMSIKTSGAVSYLSHPAKIAFFNGGTNDPSLLTTTPIFWTLQKSATALASILDQSATNDIFTYCFNTMARGRGYVVQEALTMSSPTVQYTCAHPGSPTFDGDASEWLDVGVTDRACNVYTKVSSITGTGQYTVSATGTYEFHPSDVSANVTLYISYCYRVNSRGGTGYDFYRDLPELVMSAAANFVSAAGVNYGVPGAMYNRAGKAKGLDLFTLTADPLTLSTGNVLSKKYCQVDGIHNMPYVSLKAAKTFGPVVKADYPTLARQDRLAAKPNVRFIPSQSVNGSNTHFSGFLTGLIVPAGGIAPAGGLTVYSNGKVLVDNGTGTFTGNGTGTYNYTTGFLDVTFSSAPALSSQIGVYSDYENLLWNPLLEYAAGALVALPNGNFAVGSSNSPMNWTVSVDAGLATAMAAGTLSIKCYKYVGTAPGGYGDAVAFDVIGFPGTGQAISLLQTTSSAGILGMVDITKSIFMSGHARVKRGPNGHIQGFTGAECSLNVTHPAYTIDGVSGYTSQTSTALNGASSAGAQWTSICMEDGDVDLPMMTSPIGLNGISSLTTLSPRFNLTFDPNKPVSVTVIFSVPALRTYAPIAPGPLPVASGKRSSSKMAFDFAFSM